ncbi:hypothetical protein [uncultured Dokdonia sp.]|uniref:hypothetical protein n=1 Tax=uncultured Dokdonia sp. TaxID=575653 RepID=UPI002616B770|nr:hypothetical protein [uncultured Dokdonia sp.]
MNSNLEFLSNHILDNNITEVLKIEKNLIHILGIGFPLLVDERGDLVEINNIRLDEKTSSRLTYLLWSLNFLNKKFQKFNSQHDTLELREKVVKLLITSIYNLEKSDTYEDIKTVVKLIEDERDYIKELMSPYTIVNSAC